MFLPPFTQTRVSLPRLVRDLCAYAEFHRRRQRVFEAVRERHGDAAVCYSDECGQRHRMRVVAGGVFTWRFEFSAHRPGRDVLSFESTACSSAAVGFQQLVKVVGGFSAINMVIGVLQGEGEGGAAALAVEEASAEKST